MKIMDTGPYSKNRIKKNVHSVKFIRSRGHDTQYKGNFALNKNYSHLEIVKYNKNKEWNQL